MNVIFIDAWKILFAARTVKFLNHVGLMSINSCPPFALYCHKNIFGDVYWPQLTFGCLKYYYFYKPTLDNVLLMSQIK